MSTKKTALFTSNEDVASSFLSKIEELSTWQLLHLPLEHYIYFVQKEEEQLVKDKLDSFAFIVHGNLRNARFFIQWVKKADVLEQVKDVVHLVPNQAAIDFLAEYEIPAVMPRIDARGIDIIEFMLRISRDGSVLYPTTGERDEEIPGLLQELEIPVAEFQVCREETLSSETLEEYRNELLKTDIDSIIFHSRSSLTRIQIAFPDIDLKEIECISSGQAVTQKLIESGIEPALEARGSWRSLLATLTE